MAVKAEIDIAASRTGMLIEISAARGATHPVSVLMTVIAFWGENKQQKVCCISAGRNEHRSVPAAVTKDSPPGAKLRATAKDRKT